MTVPTYNPRIEFCPLFTVPETVTLPQDDSTCDWMECTHGAAKDTIENDRNGLGGGGGGGGELHVRLSAEEGEKKAPGARNEHSAALCCRASFLRCRMADK